MDLLFSEFRQLFRLLKNGGVYGRIYVAKGSFNMNVKELCEKNRSVRNFDRSYRPDKETLLAFIDNARLSPSSVNMQPIKYFISCDDETNGKIFPLLGFAKKLKTAVPYKGKEPAAYIVICHDKSVSENSDIFLRDIGICAQTIMLSAVEKGLNGCIVGNFSPEKLAASLSLPENIIPNLVIALGKADETVVFEDIKDGNTDYYRDGNDVHHVPKRTLDEVVINR